MLPGLLRRSLILCLLCAPSIWPQIPVLSERYDSNRTGANLSETVLNTANVNVNQFGKLFTLSVDGSIYAQPLYVPGVAVTGAGLHNVLYVVTMNDKVYAFDADSNTGGNANPLWTRDYTNAAAGITPVPVADITGSNSLNITGNVGIESTPVIDPATQTMYLVARTKENGSYFQRLHAIDIRSGVEVSGSPVVIQGSAGGQTFDPFIHNQRVSLAITNGEVLIAWASHEDDHAYHGWVMSYKTATLAQTGIFCTTPAGTLGGIWESGWAPAIDASGNAYFISGNGSWNGTNNFGESFLKFNTSSGLSLTDWFTPDNWSSLNGSDGDLGASGALLIPGTSLVIGGGKQSILYLLNTGSLGHEVSGNTQANQLLNVAGGEIKSGPVYWNRSGAGGPLMYVWAANDHMKAYHFNGSTFDTTPVSQSSIQAPSGTSPGVMTLSANGSTAGSGVVWASMPVNQDGDHGVVSGVLRAFDANNLTTELWDSRQNATRDDIVTWPKWTPPVVVNGKVYMGSFSNELFVFGLLATAPPDFTLSATPGSATVTPGSNANYTVTVGSVAGFNGPVTLSVTGLPTGASASFTPATVTGSGTSTLQITTSSTTPVGTSSLKVTAVSGTLQHSATVSLVVTSTIGHGAVSIDFLGAGVAMAASEVAGVVPKAHWNSATGAASASALSLVDETGSPTSASVTWSSDNAWKLPNADQAGNQRMMNGYLDDKNGVATTVTVAGLTSATYDIYVYTDGDNGAATRAGNYQISGTGITTTTISATDAASTNFSGTFTAAANSTGNYVKFTFTGTGFTLTATPGTASDGTKRAPVNGVQIVPHTTAPANHGVSVDFVGSGVAMATSEIAGVVPKSFWNSAAGASSPSALALVDETGASTAATVTWKCDNAWKLPSADQAGNQRMMNGYLDDGSGGATTVTLSGLTSGTYDLYVYTDGDNTTATRAGTYQISGTGIVTTSISSTDPASTNFSGTFTAANNSTGNYVHFTFTGTGFTLTATPGTASDGTRRAPVNGLQVIPH